MQNKLRAECNSVQRLKNRCSVVVIVAKSRTWSYFVQCFLRDFMIARHVTPCDFVCGLWRNNLWLVVIVPSSTWSISEGSYCTSCAAICARTSLYTTVLWWWLAISLRNWFPSYTNDSSSCKSVWISFKWCMMEWCMCFQKWWYAHITSGVSTVWIFSLGNLRLLINNLNLLCCTNIWPAKKINYQINSANLCSTSLLKFFFVLFCFFGGISPILWNQWVHCIVTE